MRAHIHDGQEPMSSTSRPDTLVRDHNASGSPISLATHRRSIHLGQMRRAVTHTWKISSETRHEIAGLGSSIDFVAFCQSHRRHAGRDRNYPRLVAPTSVVGMVIQA